MPSILSWWAQLTLNVSIFSMAVYVVWSVLQSIRGEFQHMAEQESSGILNEIHDCASKYLTNGCESPRRAPALSLMCDDWQVCMDRDPAKIGHAKLSAATMATIINSFIEPISWKAVVSGSVTEATAAATRSSPHYNADPRLTCPSRTRLSSWLPCVL
jgi:hypothetical protein